MRNLDKENVYFVTGYLLGYHIGAGQDEMECDDRASFKEGYDAGCVDAVEERQNAANEAANAAFLARKRLGTTN